MASPHIAKLSLVEYDSKKHRVEDLSLALLDGKFYENTGQFPLASQDKPRLGGAFMRLGFTEQVAGSGTAGTPPPINLLLRSCGWTYVNTPSTSDVYTMNGLLTSGGLTVDVYYGNAIKGSLTSAIMESGRLAFRHGEPIKLEAGLVGLYTAPTEASGSAVLATQATPLVCKTLATTTLGGDVMRGLKECIIDFGSEAPMREGFDSGSTQGYYAAKPVNQEPKAELLFEFLDYSTANYYTDMTSETGLALSIVTGATAGNILTVAGTGYMNDFVKIEEVDGIYQVRLSLSFGWGSGEPLVLSFT